MSSRSFSKALRSPLARQLAAPAQRRSFVAAAGLVRASAVAAKTVAASPAQQQVRGVKTIDFAGSKEQVWGEFCPCSCHWSCFVELPGAVAGFCCTEMCHPMDLVLTFVVPL